MAAYYCLYWSKDPNDVVRSISPVVGQSQLLEASITARNLESFRDIMKRHAGENYVAFGGRSFKFLFFTQQRKSCRMDIILALSVTWIYEKLIKEWLNASHGPYMSLHPRWIHAGSTLPVQSRLSWFLTSKTVWISTFWNNKKVATDLDPNFQTRRCDPESTKLGYRFAILPRIQIKCFFCLVFQNSKVQIIKVMILKIRIILMQLGFNVDVETCRIHGAYLIIPGGTRSRVEHSNEVLKRHCACLNHLRKPTESMRHTSRLRRVS